ncbi:MAG: thermonuclease family protein [Candidatus Omnitrophica bacterium]|nr:thermonuclease family protein [Candidatus Omnitrophota bacterium]
MKKNAFFLFSILFCSVCFGADLNPLLQASTRYSSIRVVKVISPDSFLLEGDVKVLLEGIEGVSRPAFQDVKRDEHGFIIRDEDPTTPLEVEAIRFVRSLVQGKNVRLEFDVAHRNDQGAMVAYVFLADGTNVNAEILRQGYARLKLRAPNLKYAEILRKAYQESRREMRGLQAQW